MPRKSARKRSSGPPRGPDQHLFNLKGLDKLTPEERHKVFERMVGVMNGEQKKQEQMQSTASTEDLSLEQVRDFVIAAHGNLPRVREMLSKYPSE